MIGFLNITGLLLGLVAITLPVINIMLARKNQYKKWGILTVMSLISSTISIWIPYLYLNLKVSIEDWSALLDTTPSILKLTGALLFVTILLNSISYYLHQNKVNKDN